MTPRSGWSSGPRPRPRSRSPRRPPCRRPRCPSLGRELAVIDLEPGVCIEDAGAFTGTEVNEITQTQAIACRLPHEAEVYLRQDLPAGPDDPFPGVGALRRQAQELCRDGFEAFVGRALDPVRTGDRRAVAVAAVMGGGRPARGVRRVPPRRPAADGYGPGVPHLTEPPRRLRSHASADPPCPHRRVGVRAAPARRLLHRRRRRRPRPRPSPSTAPAPSTSPSGRGSSRSWCEDAAPGTDLRLVDADGHVVDAWFAPLGTESTSGTVDDEGLLGFGRVPGGEGYRVVAGTGDEVQVSEPITVLARDEAPPSIALRGPGAGRRNQLPGDAGRHHPRRHGPLPVLPAGRRPGRRALPHGGQHVGLLPRRPLQPAPRAAAGRCPRLRHRRREPAGHRLLGRGPLVLRGPTGGRRLRRHRGHRRPGLGRRQRGRDGRHLLSGHHPALRRVDPAPPPRGHQPDVGHRRSLRRRRLPGRHLQQRVRGRVDQPRQRRRRRLRARLRQPADRRGRHGLRRQPGPALPEPRPGGRPRGRAL